MHRARPLLTKAGKSLAEVCDDAAKSVASGGAARTVAVPRAALETPPHPYELLYHHRRPELLQPRHPGTLAYVAHHVASSVRAVMGLVGSQETRDRFLDATGNLGEIAEDPDGDDDGENSGSIIDTSVLGQSDMGFMKVLTLYQDLNGPLFDGPYSDNPEFVREFLDGCGWALEQFHRMKVDVVTRSMNAEDAGRRDSDGADKVGEDSDDSKIRPDVDLNFLQAASDPDSLDYAFMSMITPEMLDTIKMERILHVVTGNTAVVIDAAQSLKLVVPDGLKAFQSKDGKMRIVKEDTRVGKVALLGARVEEIYPPLEPNAHAEEGGSGPPSDGNVFKRHLGEMDRQLKEAKQERAELLDEPMEDDSLAASRNDGDEDAAQIVTQLEVLYELQQSAINDDGKTHTQTSVMVGKFEACVDGDPNGDEIQWRLCSYRPAVEFGYFNSW